ncbi:MAG: LemA family protein [Magnetococcales bacterium]|nr:LemA family protein [Magnetococcales bacterium]
MVRFNNDMEALGPETDNSARVHQMKKLMRQLYAEESRSNNLRLPPIKSQNLVVFLSIVSILVFGVTTLYNFNRFVSLEEQVLSSAGHIEDALQRRENLMGNLVNLALNQAALEQEVFRHVADVRSGLLHKMRPSAITPNSPTNLTGVAGMNNGALGQSPSAADLSAVPEAPSAVLEGAGETAPAVEGSVADSSATAGVETDGSATKPDALKADKSASSSPLDKIMNSTGLSAMSRLLAVVEQYPDIKTSTTYQMVMDKLVEIENRIANRRDEYNEQVRIFNTLISSFPWYLLAKITGFERYEYFRSGAKGEGDYVLLRSKNFNRLLPTMQMKQNRPGLFPFMGEQGLGQPSKQPDGSGLSDQGEP